MALSSLFVAVAISAVTHAYIWPNPQLDALERLRYDQYGYNRVAVIYQDITPCTTSFSPGRDTLGRSNAADWIHSPDKQAYHDMATYNKADGTGGLDASIRFEDEHARPENIGESFDNSVGSLSPAANRYVSVADTYALGAVAAMEICEGPRIAFRGGRVDALVPNSPGVPEPHQSLDEHVANFARQGFTSEEMIGLIACGHSFGGVERQFFPEIVPSPSNETDENFDATFDTAPFGFDNRIATEYIQGTTKNPLVVGHNKTTNSDLRIFSSDRNKTMKAFAKSPKLFSKTCAELFAKMIDSVPKGVQLTEVIEPLPVKPMEAQVVMLDDGTIALHGEVRFWDMPENSNRVVKMFWADRLGKKSDAYQATLGHTIDMVSSSNTGELHTALWYSFNRTETEHALVDPARGVSKIWFTVTEKGRTKTYDQGGVGFSIQDTLLLSPSSCMTDSPGRTGYLKIAIRSNMLPDRVFFELDGFDADGRPAAEPTDLKLSNATSIGNGTYTQYSTSVPIWTPFGEINIAAEIGGRTYRTPWARALKDCPE